VEGYATEEQQVEAIKKWWKQHGSNVITGGLLALAFFFGGRAWFDHQDGQSEAASVEYEAMMQSMHAGEKDAVFSRGDTLLQKYSGTPYATLAAFALARVKLEQNDPVAAEAHLRWVLITVMMECRALQNYVWRVCYWHKENMMKH
jgi:predicted negative regulator of RcsB-dependent stress response